MIDHDPDPGTDPLTGLDPHPREQIDLWPLHDARQELLEEIVSQPGPEDIGGSAPRRVLVPVGIVAVLALVVGGVWVAVGDDPSGGGDDQVVASSDPTDGPTDESDGASDPAGPSDASGEPAEPTEPTEPETTPIGELRRGDVLTPQQCRFVRHGRLGPDDDLTVAELETSLEELAYVTRLVPRTGEVRWIRTFRGKGNDLKATDRYIAIDGDCTVVAAGRGPIRLR